MLTKYIVIFAKAFVNTLNGCIHNDIIHSTSCFNVCICCSAIWAISSGTSFFLPIRNGPISVINISLSLPNALVVHSTKLSVFFYDQRI